MKADCLDSEVQWMQHDMKFWMERKIWSLDNYSCISDITIPCKSELLTEYFQTQTEWQDCIKLSFCIGSHFRHQNISSFFFIICSFDPWRTVNPLIHLAEGTFPFSCGKDRCVAPFELPLLFSQLSCHLSVATQCHAAGADSGPMIRCPTSVLF